MAAKDSSPMSESRRKSLNKLLPDLEAKLILDNIKSHLHIDAGGFLNEVEIIYVFSGRSRVDHVRSLFSVLKTKDNAAFGSFCLVLSNSGYGHWSKKLMDEAGLDHDFKGTPQLEKSEVNDILCEREKMFQITFEDICNSFDKCLEQLLSILKQLSPEDFKMFMIKFYNRLRGIKKNARFEQSDIESPFSVLTVLSLQDMYTQFDLEVLDVMAKCLLEDTSRDFKAALDTYKLVLCPLLEKTLSELADDAEVVSAHDDQKKQLSLAFVVPDNATFGILMKAKRYLEEVMKIQKVSNMRFDFNCITVLFDIAYPAGDIEELSESFLSDKHRQEMKKLNILDVFLLSHWAVGVTDGSICYFHEVPIQPDILPLAGVIERKNPAIRISVPQVEQPVHLSDTPPPDPSVHVTDPSHSTSPSHVTDPFHREFSAVKESKVPQQVKTHTDISPATVTGVKRLYEATVGPTGSSDLPSQDTLEEFHIKESKVPQQVKTHTDISPATVAGVKRLYEATDLSETLADLTITEVKVTEKELGRGADATVMEVLWKGSFYAGKQLHDFIVKDSNCVRTFTVECKRWSNLEHSKIVKFFGVHFKPNSSIPMLILEKMDTSLWKYLQSRNKESFPLTSKVYVLRQAGEALAYLHSLSPPLIHCDLNPNNILLNRNTLETKVTDFGMSRAVDTSKSTQKSSVKGTQAFIAPEAQLVPPKYDDKRDVFSYGNVVITMVTHEWPHPGPPTGFNDDDILVGYTEFQRRQEHLDKFTPQERECFMPVVEKCLHNRPEKRPTSHELEHEMKMLQHSLGSVRVLIQDFVPGPFLDKYKDRFLDVVVSSTIRTRLEMDKVVPAELSFEMSNTSNDQATEKLFLHLHAHASSDSIHKLCDAMISVAGYPNMNNLGEDMKNDKGLPPYSINLTIAPSPTSTSTTSPVSGTTGPEMMPSAKKPKFEERNVTCFVYRSNWYKFEYVYSAKAIDVATGIEAKGQNYKSKSGAKEHARANLKEELLKRGIIS